VYTIYNTYQLFYIYNIPPDDGLQICPKHVEVIYLNINQFDALNFMVSLFHSSTCFEHMCL
jgi:hypothetical protein